VFKSIVVATDGSEHSDRALALATEIAETYSARITVVHVVQLVGGKGGIYPAAADEDEIKAKIEGQVANLKGRGLAADLVVQSTRLSGPAREVADDARELGADLIVVGSHAHSAAVELLLGSVPLRILHAAPCPVLVVPPKH
jgi:nucleotide-binding universal stress UspA family protein